MAGNRFTTFISGTRARLTQLNENFNWFEGSLEPMSDGVRVGHTYDLGTTTAQWRNLYLSDSIVINGTTITSWDNSTVEVNAGNLRLKASGILGSTGNTLADTQRHITQGTVCDIAIRANAISNQGFKATGTSGPGASVTSFSLSTSGNPVLVCACLNTALFEATLGGWDVSIYCDMDGSVLTGGWSRMSTNHVSGSATSGVIFQRMSLSYCFIHQPAAGAHTWRLSYAQGSAVDLGVQGFSLNVVELKR